MRKFKLTAAFLVISALTLAAAGIVILNVSSSLEERNIAGLMTEQSARDATLLAGAVSRILLEDDPADTGGSAIEVSTRERDEARTTIGEFLRGSDIVRLALYETDGNSVWSSDGRRAPVGIQNESLFRKAVGGVVVSGLMRDMWLAGMPETMDVVVTYVPFLGVDTDAPVRVLGVTRNVTRALSARTDETRWAMFRATLMSIGGGFLFLLAFIVIADRAIWRSKNREIRRERELSDQRIASARMDIENRELQRLNDERGKLIGLVSHELRTPLTSILAFTDILSKRRMVSDPSGDLEQLRVIKRSGSQLLEMIDEMLDVSRLDAAEFSLDETEFNVGDLVSDASRMMDPILQMKGQKLQIFGDTDGCWIRADRGRLEQVLMNLMSNASKYSPDGTTIQLEVTAGTNHLRVAVRDEGIGIDAADRHRIFAKFFRIDREETRAVGGTGLGLAIVKSIIDQHDGKISVSSRPGGGTTISFWIPTRVRWPLDAGGLLPAPISRRDLVGRRSLATGE
ncbi:MAG: HAMP domain-containing histidine kinase [Chloroflexi bacterium]|nr:HAMP domain-containing histidine kinase [Chloroflexota bacterium]